MAHLRQRRHEGLMFRDTVEIDEQKYPIRIHEMRVREDSEGADAGAGRPVRGSPTGRSGIAMTAAYVTDGHHHPRRGRSRAGTAPSRSRSRFARTAPRSRSPRSPRSTSKRVSCSGICQRRRRVRRSARARGRTRPEECSAASSRSGVPETSTASPSRATSSATSSRSTRRRPPAGARSSGRRELTMRRRSTSPGGSRS